MFAITDWWKSIIYFKAALPQLQVIAVYTANCQRQRCDQSLMPSSCKYSESSTASRHFSGIASTPNRAPITDPVIVPIESNPIGVIAVQIACSKSSGDRQKQYMALATASSATQPSPKLPSTSTSSGEFVKALALSAKRPRSPAMIRNSAHRFRCKCAPARRQQRHRDHQRRCSRSFQCRSCVHE